MMPNCPECNRSRVDELIGKAYGVLRHFECRDCSHRWSVEGVEIPRYTHYIPAGAQMGRTRHEQAAICGAFLVSEAHSDNPSCPLCQQAIVDDLSDLAALQAEVWDSSLRVEYVDFDPCADRIERRR